MGVIVFNGKSTEELGLISQAIPSYEFPKKNYKYTHIPGRNGDLITDLRSYENVNRTYYLACIYRQGSKFIENAQAIVEWLMGAIGYCRLEDSYEPDVFRLASYVDNGSLSDIYDTATTINITFNCKPQKYLKLDYANGIDFNGLTLKVNNPTGYEAHPLIKFTPTETGEITITVNDNQFTANITEDMVNKVICIDSEIQHCYMIKDDDKVNVNKHFNIVEFPILKAGINEIEFSAGININIKPRWWRL